MFKPLSINLGLRYARSRLSFISFISLVAVGGLVLSVSVLLLVTSVLNGFERELETRILGVVPHLTVRGRAPIEDGDEVAAVLARGPGVLGATPFVQGAALLVANGASTGVMFTGIEPAEYHRVSDLANYLESGRLDDLQAGRFGMIVGARIAERLGVGPGDAVVAVMPEASVTLVGVVPRRKTMTVVGVADTGSDLDQRSVYLHIADAARLFRLGGRVEGVQMRIDDVFAVDATARWALDQVGRERFFASTWKRAHGTLYSAIGFTRVTLFLLLSLLVGVAAFNLVSALIMVVNQRRGDVAVLRTLGSDTRTIMVTFIVLGTLIGLVGVGLGVLVGALASVAIPGAYAWLEKLTSLDLMNQYFVNQLPAQLAARDVAMVAGVAWLLCLASTLYPAWRAASTEPAEVLKHE